MIGTEYYETYDRHGCSKLDMRWLRFGRGRWRVEVGQWGVYVRLGAVEFSSGFSWADD